jgi:hypothetical protein
MRMALMYDLEEEKSVSLFFGSSRFNWLLNSIMVGNEREVIDTLDKFPDLLNRASVSGLTPLNMAIKHAKWSIVLELLKRWVPFDGLNVSNRWIEDYCLLQRALTSKVPVKGALIKDEKREAIKLQIKSKAHIMLFSMIGQDKIDGFKDGLLLFPDCLNTVDATYGTLLGYAAWHQKTQFINVLLAKEKVDVRVEFSNTYTKLPAKRITAVGVAKQSMQEKLPSPSLLYKLAYKKMYQMYQEQQSSADMPKLALPPSLATQMVPL